MPAFEYKVIPAPKRGEKARGVKSTEDRFAHALTQLMNSLGAEGWDYLRADTLPCDERVGLTGSKTTYQNMLVFRRALVAVPAPRASAANAVPARDVARPEAEPVAPVLRPTHDPLVAGMTLGPAKVAMGTAPAVGPANHDVAAE
jgi:hypothetical protein